MFIKVGLILMAAAGRKGPLPKVDAPPMAMGPDNTKKTAAYPPLLCQGLANMLVSSVQAVLRSCFAPEGGGDSVDRPGEAVQAGTRDSHVSNFSSIDGDPYDDQPPALIEGDCDDGEDPESDHEGDQARELEIQSALLQGMMRGGGPRPVGKRAFIIDKSGRA